VVVGADLGQGFLHGAAAAFQQFLADENYFFEDGGAEPFGEFGFHELGAVAGNDDYFFGAEHGYFADGALYEGHVAEVMQDLGQVGLHPCAEAGRQDHCRKTVIF
jgi:hypothetical protein